MEIKYLDDLFNVVYRKFLNAIDHIEYHPTLQNKPSSETRSKRSIFFSKTGFYNTFDLQKNCFWTDFLRLWKI